MKCADGSLAAAKIFKKPKEFIHEELIMKRLKSPRIVKMFDWNQYGRLSTDYGKKIETNAIFKEKSFPYMILEFAEHKELFEYLETCGAFNEEITRYYFAQILDAIEYLHECKIVHRDIKPQNILLGKNFELKLADLGLASHESEEGFYNARGTMSYMPPEALQGQHYSPNQKRKADIYSAGIVLFNMLTGYMPYLNARRIDKLFMLFIQNREQFWNHHRKFSFKKKPSKSLEELLEGMLDPNPETRWSIKQIKESEWFTKSKTASIERVISEMKEREPYVELAHKYPQKERNKVTLLYMEKMKEKNKYNGKENFSYQKAGMLLWNCLQFFL